MEQAKTPEQKDAEYEEYLRKLGATDVTEEFGRIGFQIMGGRPAKPKPAQLPVEPDTE